MKHAYESKTIISAIYLLAVLTLPVLKDMISEEEVISIGQLVMGLVGILGVIYGRVVAKDKITL